MATRQRIYLPEWDWVYVLYYDTSREHCGMILDTLRQAGCAGKFLDRARRSLERSGVNTGLTYTNPATRTSVSVISHATSPDEFWNSLDHEKGHAARHIAQALGLDEDGEECQYLRGAIAGYMYDAAKEYLCGCEKRPKMRRKVRNSPAISPT